MTIGKFYLVTPLLANSYPNEVLKAELTLGGEGPMLFSVKPAVCWCVYLNSQE